MQKKITMGLYPQTHVNDENLISKLNELEPINELGYVELNGQYYLKDCVEDEQLLDFIECDEPTFSDDCLITESMEWFKVEPVDFLAELDESGKILYMVSEKIMDGRIFQEYEDSYIFELVYNSLDILKWLNDVPLKRLTFNNPALFDNASMQTIRKQSFLMTIPRLLHRELDSRAYYATDYARIKGWFDTENGNGQVWTTRVSSEVGNQEPVQTIGSDGETVMSEPDYPLGVVFYIEFKA